MFNLENLDETELARAIPAVMGTQHPDNYSAVPFADQAMVHFEQEPTEVYYNFAHLGVTEVMIDTEGKKGDLIPFVNVVEHDIDFFRTHVVGQDFHITPRIPNPDKSRNDPVFYQSLGIFINSLLVQTYRLGVRHRQAITEFIVPDTVNGRVIPELEVDIERKFEMVRERYPKYGDRSDFPFRGDFSVQGIPLIEDVEHLLDQPSIWDELAAQRQALTGRETHVQRSFIARSDPALKAGMVPAMLAAVAAIRQGADYERRTGRIVPQILGVGSSPFRGGLTPNTLGTFGRTYQGVATVTVQSAFRYDWPEPSVLRALRQLKEMLPRSWRGRHDVEPLDDTELDEIRRVIRLFKRRYEEGVEELGETTLAIAEAVPPRRDRYKFRGVGSYGRKVAGRPAPRAIRFCAAFYSLGLPPGLLGLRAYYELNEAQQELLGKLLPELTTWLLHEAEYLNKCNVLSMNASCYLQDVEALEQLHGGALPYNSPHAEVSDAIYHAPDDNGLGQRIIEAARERRFLG